MLSRVADCIYWMARYVERAENLTRLLLANRQLILDAGAAGGNEDAFWRPLLISTGDEEGYFKLHGEVTGDQVSEYLAESRSNPNSILNCIRAARENARMIRDQLSDEIWQCLNDIHLYLGSPRSSRQRQNDPNAFYEQILTASYLFQGIARYTVCRGENWMFLQIGTYLERADKTSRLVDACSGLPLTMAPSPGAAPLRWASLLHSCSAYSDFREISTKPDPVRILDFLFLSEEFPRSVRFCLNEVDRALIQLRPLQSRGATSDPLRESGKLRSELDFTTVEEIIQEGVHQFIDRLQTRLNSLGLSIFQTFILYADLLPIDAPVAATAIFPGAWHDGSGEDERQQQQQQQQ